MPNNIIRAFKELGSFVGNKIDSAVQTIVAAVKGNPQSIKIDMGDATKRMEETASSATKLMTAIDAFVKKLLISYDSVDEVNKVLKELEFQAKKMDNSKITFDYTEQKKTNKLMVDLVKSVKEIYFEQQPIDFTPLQKQLDKLIETINKKDNVTLEEKLDLLNNSLGNLKFDVPSTFKIDDRQFRELSVGRSSVVMGGGGVKATRNVTLSNKTLTTADTEYNYTFPTNTVSWTIRVRDTDVPLLVAFTTGKLPTSGDGTAYFTVPAYYLQEQNGLDWSGKIIYLQAGSSSQTAEILSYQM